MTISVARGPRRARTINTKRLPRRDQDLGRLLYPDVEGVDRPKTRADCEGALKPCPFVGCRYHLYLDVNAKTQSITLNFPNLEPDELTHSCALDVADHGGETLEQVGEVLNLTRERIRQIETNAMVRIAASRRGNRLREHAMSEGEDGKRRLPML